jgi:CopA family copper-resistance protein
MNDEVMSRRLLLQRMGALGLLAAATPFLPACRGRAVLPAIPADRRPSTLGGALIDLEIQEYSLTMDGRTGSAVTINGTMPGPLIRLREGQEATIRVTNRLREPTSIHWHGILLPPEMDGVPGVSFAGIEPGRTFTYRFPVRQSGTYWFHSHSGGQELMGMYAPMIIDPQEPEPFHYEREHVVMLSDWTVDSSEALLSKLKKSSGYYNYQKRTAGEFITDVGRMGFWPALQDYVMWDRMRMDPTDFADVTGDTLTYLLNGVSPAGNWTGLFRSGERVRLRLINAAAMTFYDVRIPGLTMTVVQADGQNIQPVVVEELRMGAAETYDVIVRPEEDRAYTIFAETMDRSGYARGTLAPRAGMSGELPERRARPLRTMEDMGMSMAGMDMPERIQSAGGGMTLDAQAPSGEVPNGSHAGHGQPMGHGHRGPDGKATAAIGPAGTGRDPMAAAEPVKHGPDDHGPGNQMVAEYSWNRLAEPGRGLEDNGRRVLVYADLKSLVPAPDQREPERDIEIHLTGHMTRYLWSFDGKTYSEAREPIRVRHGERLRLTFVNDTMMEHPLHLHGMWMYLENGAGGHLPRKHTVIVKPAERLSVAVTAEAPGRWAFHCHLLLHMEAGMFRIVEVIGHERNGPT